MPRHTVEISDESGNSCRILIDIGMNLVTSGKGTWRTLDKGAIRYNSGPAKCIPGTYVGDDFDLQLYASAQSGWGMRLNDYTGSLVTNDDGMGYLVQPWCLTMKPYRISWVLAD
jgi:hypothetical protein